MGQTGDLNLDAAEWAKITGFRYNSFGSSTSGDINIAAHNWGDGGLSLSTSGTAHVNGNQTFTDGSFSLSSGALDVQGDITGLYSLSLYNVTDANIQGDITGNGASYGSFSAYVYSGDISLGQGAASGFALDSAELDRISGFSRLDFTNLDASGTMTLGAHTWSGNVYLQSPNVTVTGNQVVNGDLHLTAYTSFSSLSDNGNWRSDIQLRWLFSGIGSGYHRNHCHG